MSEDVEKIKENTHVTIGDIKLTIDDYNHIYRALKIARQGEIFAKDVYCQLGKEDVLNRYKKLLIKVGCTIEILQQKQN